MADPTSTPSPSDLVQVVTIVSGAVATMLAGFFAWATERRRSRMEAQEPRGVQDLRDTIKDLRQRLDRAESELREERDEHGRHEQT